MNGNFCGISVNYFEWTPSTDWSVTPTTSNYMIYVIFLTRWMGKIILIRSSWKRLCSLLTTAKQTVWQGLAFVVYQEKKPRKTLNWEHFKTSKFPNGVENWGTPVGRERVTFLQTLFDHVTLFEQSCLFHVAVSVRHPFQAFLFFFGFLGGVVGHGCI